MALSEGSRFMFDFSHLEADFFPMEKEYLHLAAILEPFKDARPKSRLYMPALFDVHAPYI